MAKIENLSNSHSKQQQAAPESAFHSSGEKLDPVYIKNTGDYSVKRAAKQLNIKLF